MQIQADAPVRRKTSFTISTLHEGKHAQSDGRTPWGVAGGCHEGDWTTMEERKRSRHDDHRSVGLGSATGQILRCITDRPDTIYPSTPVVH